MPVKSTPKNGVELFMITGRLFHFNKNNNHLLFFNAVFCIIICLVLILDGCSMLDDDEVEHTHDFGEAENHKDYIKTIDYNFEECMECHGQDLRGEEEDNPVAGDDGATSCYSCHNKTSHTGAGFSGLSQTHPAFMQAHNWDLQSCFNCHPGNNIQHEIEFGGSCNNSFCHSLPEGPQACNTCHGKFSSDAHDTLSWAPTKGLRGETEDSSPAVGSHSRMLENREGRLTRVVECANCHVVPASWDDPGHIIDETPGRAEVVFSFPANADTSKPVYDYDEYTCSNVFCHWNQQRTWTNPIPESECGSCHGMPPHAETITWTQCQFCHDEVWSDDGLINQNMHVNGTVDICSGECHGD